MILILSSCSCQFNKITMPRLAMGTSVLGNMHLVVAILIYTVVVCTGYNIDARHGIVVTAPQQGSHFGYSVAILKRKWVFVGAPLISDPAFGSFGPRKTGGVLKCEVKIGSQPNCTFVFIDNKTGTETINNVRIQHHREGQWLGGHIELPSDHDSGLPILTCAHRWIDNKGSYYQMGLCYSISQNFKEVKKIGPFLGGNKTIRLVTGDYEYNYAMASQGMALHYTKNDSRVLVGAPGVLAFTGTLADVNVGTSTSPTIMTVDDKIAIHGQFYQLAGYALTSGQYLGSDTFYVVGVPRGNLSGEVKIYRQATYLTAENVFLHLESKDQHGKPLPWNSYFGSSLCTADVNSDRYDDLLVGAPMYSTENTDMHGARTFSDERGLVNVYLGSPNKTSFQRPTQTLTGRKIQYGRFGTAVATLGDINQDGFNDIAIGAPYESDGGAVYIYNGCKDGLWPHYTQMITGSSVRSTLQGFGAAISRGADLNGDGVNDLAVGAYLSDNAVVFHTKPVMHVQADIAVVSRSSATQVVKYVDQDASEIALRICFVYNYEPCGSAIMRLHIHLDADRPGKERLLFRDAKSPFLNTTQGLLSNRRGCFQHEKFLVTLFATHIDEITIRTEYDLQWINCPSGRVEPSIRKFDGNFPSEPMLVLKTSVMFRRDCTSDECKTDLKVSTNVTYPEYDGDFIIGNTDVNVTVGVTRTGDAAYGSELRVTLPSYVQFNRIKQVAGDNLVDCYVNNTSFGKSPTSTSSSDDAVDHPFNSTFGRAPTDSNSTDYSVICRLGNILRNASDIRVTVYLNLPEMFDDEIMTYAFEVVTQSQDTDGSNNKVILEIPAKYVLHTKLDGISPVADIFLKETVTTYRLDHIYEVLNYGPSILGHVTTEFYIPEVKEDKQVLLSLERLRIQCDKPCTVTCVPKGTLVSDDVSISVNNYNATFQQAAGGHASAVNNRDCVSSQCSKIECKFHSIPVNSYAVIYLVFQMSSGYIGQNKDSKTVQIVSRATATIEGDNILSNQTSFEHKLTTKVHPAHVTGRKFAWWIIAVSGGGGFLIILIICLILFKAGFFKRKTLDELNRRKTLYIEYERRSMAVVVDDERRSAAAHVTGQNEYVSDVTRQILPRIKKGTSLVEHEQLPGGR